MTGQIPEASATAMTPLGPVSLHVSGSSAITVEVSQAAVPDLPKGMVVDGVMLLSVCIAAPITRGSPLRLRVTADQDGDPDTGEHLDSMSFLSDDGVRHVAMRDVAWLAANGVVAEPVPFERRGFGQTIVEAAAGTVLYVSVAWRVDRSAAAANDVSTWFAADLALPY